MELRVIEHTKERLKFELKDEDHTFCNILRKELWNDKAIDISGYHVEHSLVSEPVFTISVNKGDAQKTLLDAISRLRKWDKELKDQLKTL